MESMKKLSAKWFSDSKKDQQTDKKSEEEEKVKSDVRKSRDSNSFSGGKKSSPDGNMSNSIKKFGVNLYYHIEKKSYKFNKKAATYLLGQKFELTESRCFEQALGTTIYLSYRDKFPPLTAINDSRYAYTSDRGWGCMLRAGQMMFAETIKRNLFTLNGKLMTESVDMSRVVEYFLDSDENPKENPFSIHNISEVAWKKLNRKPGEWYTATDIIRAFIELLDKYGKGLPGVTVKIVLFIDGTICEDQILEKAGARPKYKLGNVKQDSAEKTNADPNEESKTDKEPTELEWENPVLVVALSKTGLDEHNEDYLPTVKVLLTYSQSVGLLSGKGGSAYYVLGRSEDNLLYFDPHYVQRAPKDKEDLDSMIQTYTRNTFHQMKLHEMSTSVGFGFYLQNHQDYEDFKTRFLDSKQKDPNFLIEFLEKTPSEPELKEGDIMEVFITEDGFEIMT